MCVRVHGYYVLPCLIPPTLPYCCVSNICLNFDYIFLIYLEEGKTEEPTQRELMVTTKSAIDNAQNKCYICIHVTQSPDLSTR